MEWYWIVLIIVIIIAIPVKVKFLKWFSGKSKKDEINEEDD